MRTLLWALCLSPSLAFAQDAGVDEDASPVVADAGVVEDAEPEYVAPPTEPPPPMPSPMADYSADKTHFSGDVKTDPELRFLEEIAQGKKRLNRNQPAYIKRPTFAYGAEAAAGLFGASIFGLVGGIVGDAASPGNPRLPLDGFHGRTFGILTGALIGSGMGVWSGAKLFEKNTTPAWSLLGSLTGSIVGGAIATGIMIGLQSERQLGATLGVTSLFLFQIGGSILFTEIGNNPPETAKK